MLLELPPARASESSLRSDPVPPVSPGPFQVDTDFLEGTILDANGKVVAEVMESAQEGDIYLLAAAPTLKAAVEQAIRELADPGSDVNVRDLLKDALQRTRPVY